MVIIMIIISNQSPNHGTVILILGISLSCHRQFWKRKFTSSSTHTEFLLWTEASELLHRLSAHCPVDFHLMEETDEDLPK